MLGRLDVPPGAQGAGQEHVPGQALHLRQHVPRLGAALSPHRPSAWLACCTAGEAGRHAGQARQAGRLLVPILSGACALCTLASALTRVCVPCGWHVRCVYVCGVVSGGGGAAFGAGKTTSGAFPSAFIGGPRAQRAARTHGSSATSPADHANGVARCCRTRWPPCSSSWCSSGPCGTTRSASSPVPREGSSGAWASSWHSGVPIITAGRPAGPPGRLAGAGGA